ncbi:MAG: squalene/phytoene synthase family protein [Alphaproteobacteria bacterium]|jgi:NADH dehydrogenase [ubiquinone] 1 alpha subcomplex assembly factor 6
MVGAGQGRLSWCASEVRRHDHDRYLTALFAPPAWREPLFALYAFNVEIAKTREIVSDPMLGQIRLQWWRDTIGEIFDAEPREHPVLQGLAAPLCDGRLPRAAFDTIIEAREADLDETPPADLAALEAYAAATSGELTALAIRLSGKANSDALEAARQIGTAWALTGIVRAVAFHAQARRLYLPEELVRDFGVDRSTLLELRPTANLDKVVRAVICRAEALLAAARTRRNAVPRDARSPLLLATLADTHISAIVRHDYDPFRLAPAAPARPLRLLWAHWRGRY